MATLERQSFWKNYRFALILLCSITVGSGLGLILGEKASILKPFGDIFINLMFTAVVPLVFVTISSAVGNMMNLKRLGKILGFMLPVFFITGAIAAITMVCFVKLFPPGIGVNIAMEVPQQLEQMNLGEQIVKAVTVSDFSLLLSKSNMLPLVIFSILFGICVSTVGGEDNKIAKGLDLLSAVLMKLISVIMLYAPIGLGAYFASLIGEFGPQLLGAYLKTVLIYYPVSFLYLFVAFALYSFFAGGRPGVKICFQNIFPPAVTAFATGSSIANIPVNLAASRKIGIPKDIRELILPIGATMHMDGTCLSSILKIAFLFGVFGQDFAGPGTLTTAVFISILSGVVMSGVPGGGLIGEMLIVNLYGFPPEAFPIIATIGFLVDPPATMLNSTGDTVAAMMVTRLIEGKNWLKNSVTSEV